jgi:hypothetical protein
LTVPTLSRTLAKHIMSFHRRTAALSVTLLLLGCSSDDVTSPSDASPTPAARPDTKVGSDAAESTGSSSAAPPLPAVTDSRFQFVSADGARLRGSATLYLRAAFLAEGHETPAFASFLISTENEAEAATVSIDFPVELSALAAVQSWSVPTTALGIGLWPTGTAAASFRLGSIAGAAPLADGTLSLVRGEGTLSGSLATGTSAGTISFAGAYDVVCFAPASEQQTAPPGELPPETGPAGTLAHDPEMSTPFCQPFAFLRGE